MSSSHLSSTTPEEALAASQDLVSRRRGVPMLVSLRTAPPSAPDAARPYAERAVPGRGADDANSRTAALFEDYHARLAPGAGGTEAGVVAALQALAHTLLGPDRHRTSPVFPPGRPAASPASLSQDPSVSPEGTAADLRAGHFLRVVNYHNTPPSWQRELTDELRGYARDFDTVGVRDLETFARTGEWHGDRPGLLPVFYEGYRDNYEVAAAACEEAGVIGWFFVCTGFVDTPVAEQYDYALAHRIKLVEENRRRERLAMNWDEIADLHRRGHVVTPHTASHAPARATREPADIEREVTAPKRSMDAVTGGSAPATAWLEGTAWEGTSAAGDALREAGYRFLFSNSMVQRLPS
ncbi:polysaccharide deacetylase family protein [Streptomyces sp. NPDC007084]|uniref:polysaccharide deacetylase family protein n=1 Tax=Streptomyces sp. NPDC007084 TaxID=3154313 RepID=UPI003455C2B7